MRYFGVFDGYFRQDSLSSAGRGAGSGAAAKLVNQQLTASNALAATEGLALAFGPTVRVNTLMPGPFLTDVSAAWDFGDNANPFGSSALQRAGQPTEIIGAALFLMSDASSFTTGSILRADGGSV